MTDPTLITDSEAARLWALMLVNDVEVKRLVATRAALMEALDRLANAPGYNEATENYNASQHAITLLNRLRDTGP